MRKIVRRLPSIIRLSQADSWPTEHRVEVLYNRTKNLKVLGGSSGSKGPVYLKLRSSTTWLRCFVRKGPEKDCWLVELTQTHSTRKARAWKSSSKRDFDLILSIQVTGVPHEFQAHYTTKASSAFDLLFVPPPVLSRLYQAKR